MQTIGRLARLAAIALILCWLLPTVLFSTVGPDEIGVRQSNLSGVSEEDLEPGWALRIPGVHRIIPLPRGYAYLDYTDDEVGHQQPLQIRTRDNNTVVLDVSVPYRIRPGEGWHLVQAGNHQKDANEQYRFQRLAEETTVSVLREHLAELTSADFYSTERRLAVSDATTEVLNAKLGDLHLEAQRVLIRAVQFRPEYEQQLQQIQLNEQKKLLDFASETVANQQQKLDNYAQATNAMVSSREQHWTERRALLERAYQVGAVVLTEDTSAGAVRKRLAALGEPERATLIEAATKALGIPEEEKEKLDDSYLLGVRNIEAETLQYEQRVRTEADGVAARLTAEGNASLAKVNAEFEAKRNQLLGTAAGRAYIAWTAAANVQFGTELVFSSRDGIPFVLRLRDFTERFMGSTRK